MNTFLAYVEIERENQDCLDWLSQWSNHCLIYFKWANSEMQGIQQQGIRKENGEIEKGAK